MCMYIYIYMSVGLFFCIHVLRDENVVSASVVAFVLFSTLFLFVCIFIHVHHSSYSTFMMHIQIIYVCVGVLVVPGWVVYIIIEKDPCRDKHRRRKGCEG